MNTYGHDKNWMQTSKGERIVTRVWVIPGNTIIIAGLVKNTAQQVTIYVIHHETFHIIKKLLEENTLIGLSLKDALNLCRTTIQKYNKLMHLIDGESYEDRR